MADQPSLRTIHLAYMSGIGGPLYISSLDHLNTLGRYAPLALATAALARADVLAAFDGQQVGAIEILDVEVDNYITDIHSVDYFDRVMIHGAAAYDFNGEVVSVNGEYVGWVERSETQHVTEAAHGLVGLRPRAARPNPTYMLR